MGRVLGHPASEERFRVRRKELSGNGLQVSDLFPDGNSPELLKTGGNPVRSAG
jgi:hypothetical protein